MDYLQYAKIEVITKESKEEVVLNLVINGLPSILRISNRKRFYNWCFKPCYKWITFNTTDVMIQSVYLFI